MSGQGTEVSSLDNEKTHTYLNDKKTPNSLEADGPTFDAERTRKLLWKLDWHLVPFLSLLYLYVLLFCDT